MSVSLEFDPRGARRLLTWLIAAACVFAAAYVVIHILAPDQPWGPLRPFFNLDSEVSLPTWFSTIQLFCVGALLLLIVRSNPDERRLSRAALTAAGLLFVGLSADEGIEIHENLTYQVRKTALAEFAFIGQWNGWIAAYAVLGILGLAFAASQLRALWRHFRQVAVIGFAGAALFAIGAAGFEMAGYPFRGSADTETLELTMTAFEEFFEMVGVSLILYSTLLLALSLKAPHAAARHDEGDAHLPKVSVPFMRSWR